MSTSRTGPLAGWAAELEPDRLAALLLPPERALAVPDLRSPHPGAAETVSALVARSDEERREPWQVPRASDAARFRLDGDRGAYEEVQFALVDRASRAALAAAARGTDADLAEALDGVVLLLERSSWCWPAHDDAFARRGWVLPDPDAPCLDLGAGEVAAALAWTDGLIGAALEQRYPGVRALLRREVDRRVLTPFEQRRDWHWLALGDEPAHNWLAWIAGNVLTAALALVDDPQRRARLVAEAVRGLDRYLADLPPDGAVDEGYGYWWAGACRALEALDVLHHATGGALDAGAVPVVRATVGFPHRLQLGPRAVASFSDAQPFLDGNGDPSPWHALHRWAVRVGDDEARAFATQGRRGGVLSLDGRHPNTSLGRRLAALGDAAWAAATTEPPPLPARVWLPSTQVLVARAAAGSSTGLTLGVKGGHDGEAHNHLDVGTVTVTLDGDPAVVDLGRGTYSARTFSADRYSEAHIGSSWHSVPAPDGAAQGVGAAFAAADVAVDDDGAGMRLQLVGCYPAGTVASWTRHARLVHADAIEVVDAWSGAREEVVVPWVVVGEVVLDDDGALLRPPGATRALRVAWSGAQVRAVVVRWEGDAWITQTWGDQVHRLDLRVAGGAGALRTTFVATG